MSSLMANRLIELPSIIQKKKKKKVFGKEKLNLCLLNKKKSFGFFLKSNLFLRTRKIDFWFVLKKKNQIYFYNPKKKNSDL